MRSKFLIDDTESTLIANETRENVKDCHGVSIYFPYSVQEDENQQTKRLLGDNETGIVNLPLVKGGRDQYDGRHAMRELWNLRQILSNCPFLRMTVGALSSSRDGHLFWPGGFPTS